MSKQLRTLGLIALLALWSPSTIHSQDPATPKPVPSQKPAPNARIIPVRVQFVISRYQGEKKISSLPYSVPVKAAVNASGTWANLRTGVQVPIMTTRTTDGKAVPTYTYKDVGIAIDCRVSEIEGGQYNVEINVDDSSISSNHPGQAQPDAPVFRHFRMNNMAVVLKDGQTTQLVVAADPVTGEIMRMDITLSVVR